MKKVCLLLVLALCLLSTCALAETYTGTGQGFMGPIEVQITMDDGVITAVEVLTHTDSQQQYDIAMAQLPAAIVAANSADVDAVSGATNTSKGILEAVRDALSKAGVAQEAGTEPVIHYHRDYSAYAPKIKTLENGVQIQETPDAGQRWGLFHSPATQNYFNTYFYNADNRGCAACHDLEQTLRGLGHVVYSGEYETGPMKLQDCIACHSDAYSGFDLQFTIHGRHLGSTAFTNMGGNCESCHYIDRDGNFLRWDFVKYDVLEGITRVPADQMNVTVTWDQDTLTAEENMFQLLWGGMYGDYSQEYSYAHIEAMIRDDIRDTYPITFSGDMDNPCSLTINQMIELFGTETRKICSHCTINGVGGPLIVQREVTGIPLKKLVEYLGVHEKANVVTPTGLDYYSMTTDLQTALDNNALFVFEMEGKPLTAAQGYPMAFWCENLTCGKYTRNLASVFIGYDPYGDPGMGTPPLTDPDTGYTINKPGIGILTAASGQIFAPGETIHLEGYANAFDLPITKIEFSFDKRQTWIEVPTENTVSSQWVYWRMDIADLQPGAYVLEMRATCLEADGTERANEELPKFLINVK